MKSTIFNRLFMISLFICFIIQTGYSKSNYVPHVHGRQEIEPIQQRIQQGFL